MSFLMARNLAAHIAAFALILQGSELLKMARDKSVLKIWSRANLEKEMKSGLTFLPLGFIDWLVGDSALEVLAWLEIALGIVAFLHPSALAFFLLLAVHAFICIRFRGSLNGGSDVMTAIVAIGLVIAYLFKKEKFASAGLVWIAVNLMISYGRAGIAKAKSPEWRSGSAFPQFLELSLFKDAREIGAHLAARPDLAKYLAWTVIALEIALPFAILAPGFAGSILFIAVVFHFGVYWTLGLNRFFWIWLAAWPAIFYVGTLISRAV